MAQFFFSERTRPLEDIFKGVADSNRAEAEAQSAQTSADAAQRAFNKSKQLDSLFAKHTDPTGRLNGVGFMADAEAAGLGRAEIEQAAEYDAKRKGTASQIALQESMQRGAGYDASSVDRSGASAPRGAASLPGAGAPLGPSSIDPDTLRSPSDVGAPQTAASMRQGGLTAQDVVDHINGKASEDVPTVEVLGRVPSESKGEEARLPPPAEPDPFTPDPPQRTWWQEFSDSYRPQAMGGGIGGVSDAMQQDSGLFQWEPKNDSNQFRQFDAALQAKLNAGGFKDAPEYLGKIYQSVFDANMPSQPNQALIFQGAEGMAKYEQQKKDFAAGIQKARGLAAQRVMEAREKLESAAKEYGVNVYAEESHEADFGGRRKGVASGEIVRTRPVSAEEKTQGEIVANAYQDLKAAEKRGGFEGDYAAAMARAKADGNVNEDAIVGHLVAMGAWPSSQAVALKNLMRESSGTPIGDIYKAAKLKFGDLYMTNHGKRNAWFKDSRDNVRSAMQLKGYDVREKGASKGIPTVSSKVQYDALPAGAEYLGPDGARHKKGGR